MLINTFGGRKPPETKPRLWQEDTTYGVGIGVALVLPAVAWLVLPAGSTRRRGAGVLAAMAVVVPAIYVAAQMVAALLYGAPAQSPPIAGLLGKAAGVIDLTVGMTAYGLVRMLLGPLAHLVAPDGKVWPALVVAGAVGIALAFRQAAPPARRRLLALAILCAATYGIVAAGRSAFYPAFRTLLIRAERYHYVGTVPLALLVCVALAQVRERWALGPRVASALLALWLAGATAGLAFVAPRVEHHGWPRALAADALAAMRRLIDRVPRGGDVYIENRRFDAVGLFTLANPHTFPGWAALFAVYHADNVVDGRHVFFVEADARVRAMAAKGVRSAKLLVAPDAVPPGRLLRPEAPRPGRAPGPAAAGRE